MDLELLKIRLNEKTFGQNGNCIVPKLYRIVERHQDQEGFNKWLEIELREIGTSYSRSFDEIIDIFTGVNCDKARLREHLNGHTFSVWKKIEDYTLTEYQKMRTATGNVTSKLAEQYKHLTEAKGLDEINRRL